MAKHYPVKLNESEREKLRALTTKGSAKASSQRRARTLLLADEGRGDQAIAAALQIGRATHPAALRRGGSGSRPGTPQAAPPKPATQVRRRGRGTPRRPGLRRATRRLLPVEPAPVG